MMTLPASRLIRASTISAAILLCSLSLKGQSSVPASLVGRDLILVNGKIITVDVHDSVAQAIAIHDGKIVAVGTNDEIRKLASRNARVIDLHDRTATPGLIDTHCHFDETDELYAINLSNVRSVVDTIELVRQKADSAK